MSNWEGGIRVKTFVSGGSLPPSVRGTKQYGLTAEWDWFATFTDLTRMDPTDHKTNAAGLPPIDSLDLWPLLSGRTSASPRTELAIGSPNAVGGLINASYKLLIGTYTQAGGPDHSFPTHLAVGTRTKAKRRAGPRPKSI